VHLAIPDHSAKFWLTLQSLCRETDRARQWLVAHAPDLAIDLRAVVWRSGVSDEMDDRSVITPIRLTAETASS
jgi:hypothetical protein